MNWPNLGNQHSDQETDRLSPAAQGSHLYLSQSYYSTAKVVNNLTDIWNYFAFGIKKKKN